MKDFFKTALIFFLILPTLASASTREEAQAMATKAAAYIEQHGIDGSRELFQTKGGEFFQGELYVFVLDLDGKTLIHGASPKLDGKVLLNLKDPKGNYFMKDMIKVVNDSGNGWVNYMWKNPETDKLAPKVSYVQKINGMDAFAGVGVFE